MKNDTKRRTFHPPNPARSYTVDDNRVPIDLTQLDNGRYETAPEALRAEDRELFTVISNTVSNSKHVDEHYEGLCGGSGLALLVCLNQENRLTSSEHGVYVARCLSWPH